uniref:NADH:ubiquinone reductase (H(+)-translocating) n=1 Tax=Amaga expatria TaxID=2744267 RepID=A0A899L736_9PLAT|nr:NADH dehydrogenase subunit 5 [Amaga expatria]QSM34659.1 NADH dehydrogenase subunit 5 [Amaga expatria]
MIYNFLGFLYFILSIILLIILNFCNFPLIFSFDVSSIMSLDFFNFSLYFDLYSILYLSVLFSIVGSIHFFSLYYMSSDLNYIRYLIVLNLFVFSMIILVISPNFLLFLFGWDGLGFSSFLLVAWYGCFVSRSASIKTFLINRLGDGLFLSSLSLIIFQGYFNYFSYDFIFFFIILIFILASFTKSSHFPFSSWLPDAMAAPTPISALVHSSTLVTAGLYFIFRFSFMFSYEIMFIIHNLGLWTIFLGSFCGCVSNNSKKIVAFSTMSQLGLISFSLSIGLVELSFFYLIIHALFKALIFISLGSLMFSNWHNQDIRHLSNLWFQNPLILINLFYGLFVLSGFPFFSCFYIKELILNNNFFLNINIFSSFIFYLSMFFTCYYSFRLFFFLFFFNNSFFNKQNNNNNQTSLVFIILYVSILNIGIFYFYNYFFFLVSCSVILILIYLIIIIGISFMNLNLSNYQNIVNYFIYLEFLNILVNSYEIFYLIGDYFYNFYDLGLVPFHFIGFLNSFSFNNLNNIVQKNYFLNVLFIFGFGIIVIYIFFLI